MSQECGFFNAQLNGEEYDRVYLAEQFAAYFASFIGNGVFGKSMQQLEVVCQNTPNMSIKVLSGQAFINGWWYRNNGDYTLNLDIADGVLSRIDNVVLRWGNQERDMWLQVVKGEPSYNPVRPAVLRNADYYDLLLATVSVDKGAVNVSQMNITDTRMDSTVCGWVTGVIEQIDTTDLYNQFEAYYEEFKKNHQLDYDATVEKWEKEFDTWFRGIKDKLSGDVAGSLQLQVDDLNAKQPTEHYADIEHNMNKYVHCSLYETSYACGTQRAGEGPCGGTDITSIPLKYSMLDKDNVSISSVPNLGVVEDTLKLSNDMHVILFEGSSKSLVVSFITTQSVELSPEQIELLDKLGESEEGTLTFNGKDVVGATVTVDDTISSTSTNPVQNKVIKAYVDNEVSENVDFSTSKSNLLNDSIEAQLVLSNATRNLLNPTLQTTTQNGVTCTNNGDGTYTLNGTASADAEFYIPFTAIPNTKYRILGTPKNSVNARMWLQANGTPWTIYGDDIGGGANVIPTAENCRVTIRVNKDTIVNNLIFKPMLTTDLTATYDDFVPYSGYDIKTCGKNLVDVNSFISSQVFNGVTFTTDKKAGTITLNGTAAKAYADKLFTFSTIDGIKEYSFGGWDTSEIAAIQDNIGLYSEGDYHFDGIDNSTNIKNNKRTAICLAFKAGVTFNNFVIKPYVSANYNTYVGYDNVEPYQDGGTVHIDYTTQFPLFGLKSFNGETNIISPGNVEVTYAKSDSGAAIMDLAKYIANLESRIEVLEGGNA